MQNRQAQEAGERADEIINKLSNPSQAIDTDKATVEVLDQVTPVVTTPEPTPVDDGNWENRFKGIKASSDKTIHALRQQVSQFDLFKEENDRLKKDLADAKAKIPDTPNELLKHFSEEEVDGITKAVDGKVSGLQNEVERLQKELGSVKEEDAKAAASKAHRQIVDAVASAVPEYSKIDVNPKFNDYMNALDSFGNVRYDMLMRAKNSTPPDIGRIVQFYVDFAKTEIEVQDEPRKQYTQQELLQNPNSSPSARAEAPQSLGIHWDLPTIQRFYKDKKIGKIPIEMAEKLEQDLYNYRKRK